MMEEVMILVTPFDVLAVVFGLLVLWAVFGTHYR